MNDGQSNVPDVLSIAKTALDISNKAHRLNEISGELRVMAALVETCSANTHDINFQFLNGNGRWEDIRLNSKMKNYEPAREILVEELKSRLAKIYERYENALDAFGPRKSIVDE